MDAGFPRMVRCIMTTSPVFPDFRAGRNGFRCVISSGVMSPPGFAKRGMRESLGGSRRAERRSQLGRRRGGR